jgi:hypothetical protein
MFRTDRSNPSGFSKYTPRDTLKSHRAALLTKSEISENMRRERERSQLLADEARRKEWPETPAPLDRLESLYQVQGLVIQRESDKEVPKRSAASTLLDIDL